MGIDAAFTTRAIATNSIRLQVVGLVPPSLADCDQGKAVFFEEATHWIAHEEPEAVSRLLVEHFGGLDHSTASAI